MTNWQQGLIKGMLATREEQASEEPTTINNERIVYLRGIGGDYKNREFLELHIAKD